MTYPSPPELLSGTFQDYSVLLFIAIREKNLYCWNWSSNPKGNMYSMLGIEWTVRERKKRKQIGNSSDINWVQKSTVYN